VLARTHRLATVGWSVVAAGAGAGFMARDALGLEQPWIALAWTIGAVLPLLALARRGERGGGRP
jgi:hypothetical protein